MVQAVSSMMLGNALYNVEMLSMSDMNKSTMTVKTKGFGKAAKGGPNRVRVLKLLYVFMILGFGGAAFSCKKCDDCAGGGGGGEKSEESADAPAPAADAPAPAPARLLDAAPSWNRRLLESEEDVNLRGWRRRLQDAAAGGDAASGGDAGGAASAAASAATTQKTCVEEGQSDGLPGRDLGILVFMFMVHVYMGRSAKGNFITPPFLYLPASEDGKPASDGCCGLGEHAACLGPP